MRALQEAVLSENGHYLRELEYSIAEVVYYVLFDFIIKERYQFNRTIKDHWSNPKIRVVSFAQDSLYEKEACFL